MSREGTTRDAVRDAAILACRQLLHAMRLAAIPKPTPQQARMAVDSLKAAKVRAAKAVELADRQEGGAR